MDTKPVTMEDFKTLTHEEQLNHEVYDLMSWEDLKTLLSEMSTDYEVRGEIARYMSKQPAHPAHHNSM